MKTSGFTDPVSTRARAHVPDSVPDRHIPLRDRPNVCSSAQPSDGEPRYSPAVIVQAGTANDCWPVIDGIGKHDDNGNG
jgi:hypothetical protein